ncbi:hypothetical protein Sango_2850600 [Sesamum angolense]|uniref:Gag/pol protein n=1 Tax=Sesamum angolense TaxID=2727404 RepID=A0AAE1VZH8_9LAMI|nr:hypothetical protein Sango_2850600 [Sesamum angolense]
MLSLVEKLEDLKAGLDIDTYIDVILQSLLLSYDPFIVNFNMNGLGREASTSKVKGKRVGRWKRNKGKVKAKTVVATKDTKSAPVAPVGIGKGKRKMGTQQRSRANDICSHCHEKGHWKRDCPNLSPKGIFVVEVLQRNGKLSKDEQVLRLGDGKAVAAEAMRYKCEAFVRFKEFRLQVENQTGGKIKILRSDRGRDYLSGEFIDYLKENGIVSHWSPPRTPQLNGVAEWRNRTLLDMIRSMMSFTELPLFF